MDFLRRFYFSFNIRRSLLPRVPLTIQVNNGSGNGSAPNRRPAITRTNVDPVYWVCEFMLLSLCVIMLLRANGLEHQKGDGKTKQIRPKSVFSFCRRHFYMHFLERKYVYLDWNFSESYSWGANGTSVLIQLMACPRTADKPLPEPVLNQR